MNTIVTSPHGLPHLSNPSHLSPNFKSLILTPVFLDQGRCSSVYPTKVSHRKSLILVFIVMMFLIVRTQIEGRRTIRQFGFMFMFRQSLHYLDIVGFKRTDMVLHHWSMKSDPESPFYSYLIERTHVISRKPIRKLGFI